MNIESFDIIENLHGKDITNIIDSYIECPKSSELIQIPDIKYKYIDYYIHNLLKINISKGLELVCDYADGNMAYRGRECDWTVFNIYSIDRFYVSLLYQGCGDDEETVCVPKNTLKFKVYKKNEMTINDIVVKEPRNSIKFMLDFFGGDIDKFCNFVKTEHNKM